MSTSLKNDIWLRHANRVVKKVEALRPVMQERSDDELKAMTETFKKSVANGTSLNSILPEAFALVREAARRVLGMEPYPVQLIGGLALHEGKIAEMRTGEGKTLVATLPAYLNALAGKGVHVVTVNDYLAQRDAEQMGKVHNFLGLSVGVVLSASSPYHKKQAYACDITYVTNTELGFDYLRDNMAKSQAGIVMRGLEFAIIDEVDSILIDEARTPLIISGDAGDVSKVYIACDALAKVMEKSYSEKEFNRIDAMLGELEAEKGDFVIHEKDNLITLTAQGIKRIENYFGLECYSDPRNLLIQHVMDQALRANYLMHRDKDYIVRDGQVLIVDTFTGRIMDGRQFSDGLHQAIEAKEGVEVKRETKTIATTTYQNFFNKFKKVAGMTGTAATERKEFKNTYHLSTVVIPTNKPVIRVDHPDVVYLSKSGKFAAVIEDIKKTHAKGQPILVGTASVRTSEELSELLHQEHIPHRVLNAKQDQEEAEIIAQAGKHGAITIATNMAGRGTDIILDEEAVKAGGLKVIGTERHEAERIDNQLRGRAGRQGDPGESVFYLATDDDMVRLFGTDRFKNILKAGGYQDDEEITNPIFKSSIRKAQRRVEDNHFAARKNVLEFDQVNDKQREMVYRERRKLLAGENVSAEMQYCIQATVDALMERFVTSKKRDDASLMENYRRLTNSQLTMEDVKDQPKKKVAKLLIEDAMRRYNDLYFATDEMRQERERGAILAAIDAAWMEQLRALDFLRQSVNYVGYAQRDPKATYAVEAFTLYEVMESNIYVTATYAFFTQNGQERPRKAVIE